LVPDLTIVLDFPVADGIERVSQRGSHDRIEQSAIEFHKRVEQAFVESTTPEWQNLHPECGPITKIDARGAREDVFARVIAALVKAMPTRFSALTDEVMT
jgi:dTMP kinase